MSRVAERSRRTRETEITIRPDLDGTGEASIETGIGFFDHMLGALARHGMFDLEVRCAGDLHIDAHHTVEDVGIVLGAAFAEALGEKRGVVRYADATVPLDEALVRAVVDLSGRPYLHYEVEPGSEPLGNPPFDPQLAEEFWRAFATSALITLHLDLKRGKNSHHILEASFKAVARALRAATEPDPRLEGPASTKGVLES